jgi:hypothetical protein
MSDYFLRKAVATLRDDLFPELQAKFDKWAEKHTLQQQLGFLTEDAMKRYVEPEFLKERTEAKDTMGVLTGKPSK